MSWVRRKISRYEPSLDKYLLRAVGSARGGRGPDVGSELLELLGRAEGHLAEAGGGLHRLGRDRRSINKHSAIVRLVEKRRHVLGLARRRSQGIGAREHAVVAAVGRRCSACAADVGRSRDVVLVVCHGRRRVGRGVKVRVKRVGRGLGSAGRVAGVGGGDGVRVAGVLERIEVLVRHEVLGA